MQTEMGILKIFIFITFLALVARAEKCSDKFGCAKCIEAGCNFYVTENTMFCEDVDVLPKIYLFRATRVASCTSFDPKQSIQVRATRPEILTQDVTGVGVTNDGIVKVVSDQNTLQKRVSRSPLNATAIAHTMCQQYLTLFEHIHPKRDVEKEKQRCNKKIYF